MDDHDLERADMGCLISLALDLIGALMLWRFADEVDTRARAEDLRAALALGNASRSAEEWNAYVRRAEAHRSEWDVVGAPKLSDD